MFYRLFYTEHMLICSFILVTMRFTVIDSPVLQWMNAANVVMKYLVDSSLLQAFLAAPLELK